MMPDYGSGLGGLCRLFPIQEGHLHGVSLCLPSDEDVFSSANPFR